MSTESDPWTLPGSSGNGSTELHPGVIDDQAPRFEAIQGEGPNRDERTVIEDVTANPWRMICNLDRKGRDGKWKPCGTGWLAGPKTVITAGHCVRDMGYWELMYHNDGWLPEVRVVPGRTNDDMPYGEYTTSEMDASPEWISAKDNPAQGKLQKYDYGAIFLPRPVDVGYFTVQKPEEAELKEKWVTLSGYPLSGDDKFPDREKTFDGRLQYFHHGKIFDVEDGLVVYNNDATSGQSGSPIIRKPSVGDPRPQVIAIHTQGEEGEGNRGPIIREDVFNQIKSWVEDPRPQNRKLPAIVKPFKTKKKRRGLFARLFGKGGDDVS